MFDADEIAVRVAAYENSRPELRALVPPGSRRILDLGCSSGAVGERLIADLGAEVIGVEIEPAYVVRARERLTRVVEGDLQELIVGDELVTAVGSSCDCVLAGDVLEHLVDPWRVLESVTEMLAPGGTAIVSLPNVRYWETLWQVGVKGTWPRRQEGIFDRTHLRWFTVADGVQMITDAGLEPRTIVRQYRFGPRGTRFDRYARLFERTPLRPFLAFQFAVVATKV